MKKKIPAFYFLLALFLCSAVSHAQDARFSQYFNNPVMVNPALAGNGIEHIRIAAIYRNQWSGMGTPFTTQGLGIDKVVNRVGIGTAITRNAAGDASIKTLNVVGNLAYHLPLGSNKKNTLSGGLQVGVIHKSFDPSKLTFDNQYNPDQGYDPNQSSGEVFTNTSITRPDINAGFMWQRGWLNKEIRFKPFASIGYFHLNRPNESFIVDDNRMPIKRTIYAGAGYMINDQTEIRPTAMLLSQGTFNETTFGALMSYQLDNKNTVQLGIYNRMNDAVISYAGYQMNQLFVGMSYDINTGELSKTGKGTNAFEISISYSPRPKKKKEPEEVQQINIPDPALDPKAELVPIESIAVIAIPLNLDQTIISLNQEIPATIHPEVKTETEIANNNIASDLKETNADLIVQDSPKSEIVSAVAIVQPANSVVSESAKDTDEDGITDNEDDCPFIKGNVTMKGCPDIDSDGIADKDDDCPLESGPRTNRGCPDPNLPAVQNQQELVKTFDHILFATGSTKLTTDDVFDIIERAVDILYADKTTSVLLSGHTDSEGNALANMNLSQARTDIVKGYLIKQGIDESRIRTVAYGETMPLRDNFLKDGKKQNRRVELNILRTK